MRRSCTPAQAEYRVRPPNANFSWLVCRPSDFWIYATRAPGDRRFRAFAIKIEPVLLPVCSPNFFKIPYVLGVPDAESQERQDHGAKTDVRLRAVSNVPTSRTP
jgi:hypothetical protein